ncbi:MAG: isocitrate/isopropylmalate dehydrogenase family protein, partial [Eubacterium sp.]|nr:isocitrate/isopropylmalate dehydrogenase family protein [Eubacterium sp.]
MINEKDKIAIDEAVEKFRSLMEGQLERAKRIKEDKEFIDFEKLDTIVIGICGGDGIGPVITKESERVLEYILKAEVASGKVQF